MLDSRKCKNCGKPGYLHNTVTKACPIGKRHRTVGYTQYHAVNKFEPKEKN